MAPITLFKYPAKTAPATVVGSIMVTSSLHVSMTSNHLQRVSSAGSLVKQPQVRGRHTSQSRACLHEDVFASR